MVPQKLLSISDGLADVSVSESNVWSILLYKRELLEKLSFCITYNDAQKHEGFVGFKTPVQSKDLRHRDVTELCPFLCL